MVFDYRKWNDFCKKLHDMDLISIPACEVSKSTSKYIVLKHDVETDVNRALELAKIECKYGHRGSYYVQAYLVKSQNNINVLKQMQQMGHEISYHYDVMDSNRGSIDKAIQEFEENRAIFETNGFQIVTVCQHGNPVVERIGYTSNRDFFRNSIVQAKYPMISDIMVDFKEKYNTNYSYYSDAGRKFSLIYDPINNDRIKSDDKNILFEDLDGVLESIKSGESAIISTHPHRWTKSVVEYTLKNGAFRCIKNVTKALLHIPFMKKIINKYYYLAKKI